MTLFIILASLGFVSLGAVFGRMDGGGIVKTSEIVERALVMYGFVLAAATTCGLASLGALAGAVGIATGHGQYFLNGAVKAIKPEAVDFAVSRIFGQDPRTSEEYKIWRGDAWKNAPQEVINDLNGDMKSYGEDRLYWRSVFGMFLTGSLVGIPAGVLMIFFGQIYGALFLLTGIVKSISYMVGQKVFGNTYSAEYLNGGGRNALCLIVILLSI